MSEASAQDLLRFWFEETAPGQWFRKDPAFDQHLLGLAELAHRKRMPGRQFKFEIR